MTPQIPEPKLASNSPSSNTFKAVIIEDEKKSREALKNLITEFCPEISISGMAESVESGLAVIKTHHPAIVFLDIEMQTGTGFDLLEKIPNPEFEVIFTTAYEQYALKAIKFSALDYLLKPIDIAELKAAVKKVTEKETANKRNEKIEQLIKNLNNKQQPKITLSTSEGLVFVSVHDIIRCEAQGAYTTFYLKGKKPIMVSKNLKEYENMLTDYNFFRIHNSHLINLAEIEKYIKSDGGYVIMNDQSKVVISNARKDEFMEIIKGF